MQDGFQVKRLATDVQLGGLVEVTETVTSHGRYALVSRKKIDRDDLLFRFGKIILPHGD